MKMKKTTLPSRWKSHLVFAFALVLSIFSSKSISAQCTLACNGNTQVSLDSDCQAEVTADMLLNGANTSCPGGNFQVTIMDNANNVLPTSPFVDYSHIGKTWKVSVKDISVPNGNECWGYITVEDKIAPVLECDQPTEPIFCYQIGMFEPTIIENCDGAVLHTGVPVESINDCQGSMPDSILKEVTITYWAEDASGNVSNSCDITYQIKRLDDLDDINFPDPKLLSSDTHLECDADYAKLPNGNPSPLPIGGKPGCGVPEVAGFPLYPSDGQFCNLIVTFDDTELPAVGCVTKIMRKWDVFEWSCSNPARKTTFTQMIEIVDSEGPTFYCPDDFHASTSGHECEGYVALPALDHLYDNCSHDIRVDILFEGGSIENSNGGIANLPYGTSEVTYIAYDECLNSTTCTIQVTVEDHTPPVTVCDQHTVVGLTNGGMAHVHARSFDDGSYDDCGIESFVVRRMPGDDGQVACQPCKVPTFNEFTYLGEYNGHHYYVSKWAKRPKIAFKYAEALGGYVFSVNNAAENAAIAEMAQNVTGLDYYTIGLSASHGSSTFSWDDNSTSSYRNFDSGEEPYDYKYVMSYSDSGKWYYSGDNYEAPFIIEIEDICGFSEYAQFCCEDLSTNDQMVTFRAIDAYGNYNDCMVEVNVQDKVLPTLKCPADMTVQCDFVFDENDLSTYFGEPTIVGNCSPLMETDMVSELNQCNIGEMTRTFTIVDSRGNAIRQCEQHIYFRNNDPFDLYYDVIPPQDVHIYDGCADPNDDMFLPENTGVPTFRNEDQCDLVGYNYTDQVFTFNDQTGQGVDACFKILRTFTIIDWCQNYGGSVATHSFTQVIKVVDNIAPEITGSCEPIFQCTYDSQCQSGDITLSQTAEDTECTTQLDWYAVVDFNYSDHYDTTPDQRFTGSGNAPSLTRNFPVGEHRVEWTFLDKCGNTVTCAQDFTIANCKTPTPYCHNGLAVDLMPIDEDGDGEVDLGMVELWASDFDAGSFHPCPGYDVVVSFSADTTDKAKTFTCDSIGEAQVMIWATAIDKYGNAVLDTAGNMLQAFCNTFVDVQDNMNACSDDDDDDNNRVAITGNVNAFGGAALAGARVSLMNASTELMMEVTGDDGSYAFPTMGQGGDYIVSPHKTDDTDEGVSTLDLVLIQRHILGIKRLTETNNIIAADINKDENITGADVVALRKLILGVTTEFPNNESWRFVDANYTFVDAEDPLNENFPEEYVISALNSDMNIDFDAVKVGDVNNSIDNLNGNTTDNRSAAVVFTTGEAVASNGQIAIPVIAKSSIELSGMQFTLDLGQSEFAGIESDMLTIGNEHVNVNDAKIAVSYASNANETVAAGDVLFTIMVNATALPTVEMTSDLLDAEIYDANYSVRALSLDARSAEEMQMMQNTPNPFMHTTNIDVYAPNAAAATLTVHDVTGKVLATYNETLTKGMNTIQINSDDLGATGVLFYTLKTDNYSATKRMVVLK